jgi:uncharacterized protein DUF11
VKPRVVPPSPEGSPSPKPESSPKRELRPAAGPAPEPGPTIADRFSRAARYHSILMGRGAHHFRRHLKRIRTPQAVHGLVGSLRSRWWPNSTAEGEAGSGKRLRIPLSFPRRSAGPAGEAGAEGPVKKHSTHRLAWDFAVITAGAAVLLVLHHHFKRPLHAATTQAVANLDPAADGTPKKSHRRRRSHAHSPAVAVAERPVDSVRDSGPALPHSDTAPSLPQQSEPAPSQNNNAPLDTVKRDDWASSASTSQPPSTSAVAGNAEPPQSGLSENKLDPPKDAGPALAGDDHAAVSSPAPAGDSTAPPSRHRRRHHSPDPAVASAGDSSFPNFNDAPAGPSDFSHKTDGPPPSGPPAADKTPLTAAPGPSLGGRDDHSPPLPPQNEPLLTSQTTTPGPADAGKKDDLAPPAIHHDGPVKDALLEPKGEHSADKPAAPPSGPDVFGALQDPPAEKHDLKEPEKALPPAGDSLATPADAAPPKRRRKRKPPQTEVASDNPLHPAATPANEPVPDAMLHDAIKAEDAKKPLDPPKGPEFEHKKDEFAAPVAVGDLPAHKDREKDHLGEPKPIEPKHKPALAADHDAFGALKDAPPPPKHDEHEIKVAEPPLNIAGDNPPNPEPPRHRRKRKPPEAAPSIPSPALTGEPSPATAPAPAGNSETKAPSEVLPALTETPKPVALDPPNVESKPVVVKVAEPKPAEVSALPGPSLDGNPPAAKSELKPENIAGAPANISTVNPPAANLVPAPVEESPPATLSFARRLPDKIDAANSLTYKIVVRNNGAKPVKLVEIDESVPADRTVQTTEPVAETHDQTLHWSLHDLGPHEERAVAITLAAPPAPQPILRTAALPKPDRVEEEPPKTAKTEEPEKAPHLQLELIAPTSLHTGETCRIGFRATNLGPKSAALMLHLDLPAGIHFQRGEKLQYKVGGLDENESREDYLSAVAAAPGVVEIHAELLLDGRSVASTKATCRITGASVPQQSARAKRDPMVVPASATTPAPATAAPCNCGP